MIVNIKNGSGQFLARRVYITSNLGWENWWGTDLLANKNNRGAIERRITVNKIFDKVFIPDIEIPPSRTYTIPTSEYCPNTMLGDEDDFTLLRANASVGENTFSELFCDEEQEFLQNCFNGNNQ